MRGNAEITALLLMSLIVALTRGDTSYNVINREDPCISLCEKTPPTFANSVYVKSCCQRGCRFFNLVDLRYGLEPNNLNGTRDACEASCTEAYTELQDRYACSTGCDFMAKQRVSDLLALFSIAICMEDGIDSNVLLMSPDIPENDILTDPGLRKELLPRWWDSDGFKLPQTYVKTVPMDAGTVDYALSSDYSGETEQAASKPASDWLHCASKHIGLPYWYLAPTIVGFTVIALLILWVCLWIGNLICQKDTSVNKSSLPMVTWYVPLYKDSMYSSYNAMHNEPLYSMCKEPLYSMYEEPLCSMYKEPLHSVYEEPLHSTHEEPLYSMYKEPPPKYAPSSDNCEF